MASFVEQTTTDQSAEGSAAAGTAPPKAAGREAEFRSALSMLAPRHVLHSTPAAAIAAAFDEFGLVPADKVLDIGCGDGRALIEAGRRGCRAVGYEIHEARAAEAERNVVAAGLADRVSVVAGNVMEVVDSVLADEVTIVFLFLTDRGLARVLPYLRKNPNPLRVATWLYAFRGLSPEEKAGQKKTWVQTKPNDPYVKFPLFTQVLGGSRTAETTV